MSRTHFFYSVSERKNVLILGKSGKTICKTAIEAVLHTKCKSYDRQTFTQFNDEPGVHVFDIPIHHKTVFQKFRRFVDPNIVIVTNIGEGHLVYQSNTVNYFQMIKSYLKSLPKETVFILNKDDDLVSQLAEELHEYQIIKFGLNKKADIYASEIVQNGPKGIHFKLNNVFQIRCPIYEFNHIYNILSAIALARIFNVSVETIQKNIETHFSVPEGRGNLVHLNAVSIINDTYKNTKLNVATAAQTLVSFKNYYKRMIMVIGEIDAEGANSYSIHVNSGHFLSALPIDIVMTVGEKTKPIYDVMTNFPFQERIIIHANNVQEAVMNLCLFLDEGDCILLKSNEASGLTQFIEILQKNLN